MKKIVNVKLGKNVKIYDFVNLYGCKIGDNTKIGSFVEITKGVVIGKNCKISSHSFICEGVTIEDNVFIGHNVTFINDRYPRATDKKGRMIGSLPRAKSRGWKLEKTIVEEGASIGSGATILSGITIGKRALVGAGAVVTKDVPAKAIRKINDQFPNPNDQSSSKPQ